MLHFLLFTLFFLLNLNYTILRSLRNTLAVVDLGSGAQAIPFFELFGALPGAVCITWALGQLLHRFSMQNVFLFTLIFFLGFFLAFAFLIYPTLPKQSEQLQNPLILLVSMLFYVISELWKPALTMVLFWGLVNQYLPLPSAKKLYAPLMLAGSLGSIVAGPLISFCSTETSWAHCLQKMAIALLLVGVFIWFLYLRLWKFFTREAQKQDTQQQQKTVLRHCTSWFLQDQTLRLLSWTVIADYISYSIGEVIFLHLLQLRFPQASDYFRYMGSLAFWSGVATLLNSLFFTPWILQNYRWVVASLVTPLCLLLTEGLFFLFLRGQLLNNGWFGWTESDWMGLVILLGSIQYCLCRGAKYTFFDASKEIAFVLLPPMQRMRGKLLVDGVCARLGRGSASVISMILIKLCGGVCASSFLTGIIALGIAVSWIRSAYKLGKIVDC